MFKLFFPRAKGPLQEKNKPGTTIVNSLLGDIGCLQMLTGPALSWYFTQNTLSYSSPPIQQKFICWGVEGLETTCTDPGQQAGVHQQPLRWLQTVPLLSPALPPSSGAVSRGGRQNGREHHEAASSAWPGQTWRAGAPLPHRPGLAPSNTPARIAGGGGGCEVKKLCSLSSLSSSQT